MTTSYIVPLDSPVRKKHVALDMAGTYHPAIPSRLPCGTSEFVIYLAKDQKVKNGERCETCYAEHPAIDPYPRKRNRRSN